MADIYYKCSSSPNHLLDSAGTNTAVDAEKEAEKLAEAEQPIIGEGEEPAGEPIEEPVEEPKGKPILATKNLSWLEENGYSVKEKAK